ncbi:protein kinase domain-containing protein [Nocardia flavorosea]|uniref:non-specific serine/threonine protein kinase n=1 Tax=Nocardia flavorosea TaxID=53429 RepID=A0A846YLP6_9NOCA|nr:protein kinase [Nocardia flavorosea]NKY60047.1 protein kinase [Nocardia flavorosea]
MSGPDSFGNELRRLLAARPEDRDRVAADAGTERVLVADFGIARSLDEEATVTGGGHREYSPYYVAPERFLSSLPDHRSDIYSFGATLYQLLTGSFPYPNRSDRELIHVHRHEPVPVPSTIRPTLPAAFDDVIARAMVKDPADRYQSCEELAVAARYALSGTPPSASRSARRFLDTALRPDTAILL